MSRVNRKKNEHIKTQPVSKKYSPISQPHLQQQFLHLQTVLMLTQFNSTFYQLSLGLSKSTQKCQKRYQRLKMIAFLKIKNYKPDHTNLLARQQDYRRQQKQKNRSRNENELILESENEIPLGWQKGDLLRQDKEEIRHRVLVCCKQKLMRMVKMVKVKRKAALANGFHRILQAYVAKSSRIDTNDSHKSKIISRSISRKPARKSFSMQKSVKKTDGHGPVKYQRKVGSSQNLQDYKSVGETNLNKFLQDRGLGYGSQQRQRDYTNSRSYKRINMSLASSEREELIRELEYLRGKYKKIIDQFNGFSDRFLRVIEQQDNGQRE